VGFIVRLGTAELNFSGAQEFGCVKRADIHFNDWTKFCRHRRVLQVIVKTVGKSPSGIYQADYRDPIPRPADLWPVPACEQPGEQVSVDDASLG